MTSTNLISPPSVFCWTRFGVEAGQAAATILARKEIERCGNKGVFLWGIGNSILPSIPLLLKATNEPKVVFSPIRSRPRELDVAPCAIAVWTRARALGDAIWPLPDFSLVTSHAGRAAGRHYALVCRSFAPLELDDDGPMFRMSEVANLRSDRPVGSSQVTSIVRYRSCGNGLGAEYRAAMITSLVAPYVVALEAPLIISTKGLDEGEALNAAWAARSCAARANRDSTLAPNVHQYELFA